MPSSELVGLARRIKSLQDRQGHLSERLERIESLLPGLEDELRHSIYELQDAIAAQGFIPDKEADYKLSVRRIRQIVERVLPPGGAVAVIGRPDRALLNIHGRRGFCLPQNRDGEYTGYYPACDTAALAQLESVRSKGADYLIVPETSRWWLEHYSELKRHVDRRYRLLVDEAGACQIFDLRHQPQKGNFRQVIKELVDQFETRFARNPSILDWNTGLKLAAGFTDEAVFSPSRSESLLPYLDSSVDVVVCSSESPIETDEAARVAAVAVVWISPSPADDSEASARVAWIDETRTEATPTVSIIIPCFNHFERTEACLNALAETLPESCRGEIIVVDDSSDDETLQRLQQRTGDDDRLKIIRNAVNKGFLASCNQAARIATGEILVFLNNDTIPLPDWLPALLRVFREHPDAGAVGAKLVYPEGKLQEAGGVVFRDGTAANFGRDDYNPDHPIYSYLREVDYCSGASLATKRELFEQLGEFDSKYSPAYYEDTDYCFKVREAGHKVYFQPESVVVHYEGATAGLDLSVGSKRYQIVNEVKFLKRWRESLKLQPDRPSVFDFRSHHALAVRGRRTPPTVESGCVLVCALMPEFDRDSGSRRVLHLIESLQEAGWTVTFVSHHAHRRPRYSRELERRGVSVYLGDQLWMEPLLSTDDYDLAVFGLWDIAEPHIPLIRSISPRTRILVDSIDLHFLRNARRGFTENNPNGVVAGLDSKYGSEMIRELNTYAAADAVLTVSQKEADLINDFVGERGLAHRVPDREETPAGTLPLRDRRGIVFVGCFRHPPNASAVEYLCREILPRIQPGLLAQHPVYIVGDGMTDEIRNPGKELPYVRMVGWVPSVVPYLRQARVSVVPLRFGAGTKRKLVEALLHGTPSVSTSVGTEGLDLEHGKNVLVADDAERFASCISELLLDDNKWLFLKHEGRVHMETHHGRENARAGILKVLGPMLARDPKSGIQVQPRAAESGQPMSREEYVELVGRIHQTVEKAVVPSAGIAVVSKGDDTLLDLGGRRTWHFPQDDEGSYPGYYPADDRAAIDNLRMLERKGADHVLFPSSAIWWLEHYPGLRAYLDSNYDRIVDETGTCIIYGPGNRRLSDGEASRLQAIHSATVGQPSPLESVDGAAGNTAQLIDRDSARLIAFYLPQFHPIPENDTWWGKGFTEWTNVTCARPMFPGHYQPRLPADLGYYDLRLPEVREAQSILAKESGLHGFCYYHYWFDGKRLLGRPLDEFLSSGKPDFPFCLCWANEPWSRQWDGRPRDVLQAQTYSIDDDKAHIRWLLPALSDPRAIRIDGRPVLIVYQAQNLPNPGRTAELWREEAVRHGLGDLYLMTVETGWDADWDATGVGFDAKVLFQPQFASLFNSGSDIEISSRHKLRVFDYQKAWPVMANPEPVTYRRYDTVCTSWDNSARRGGEAVVLHGSTPGAYESWLSHAIARTERCPVSERVVFINAWNEWAEGCHLEPDQRYGRAYLQATQRALASARPGARSAAIG